MMDNETFDEVLNGFKEVDSIVKRLKTRIAELEEENRKLKEYNENLIRADKKKTEHIEELEEENKNLKEEVKKWKMVADENETHYDMLEEENKKLREERQALISTLESMGYGERTY